MYIGTNIDCFSSTVDVVTCIATVAMAIIALIALVYSIMEYNSHKKREQSETLSKYNERYSNDENIKKVVTYLICKMKCPDVPDYLGTFEKEMFLRFFEELQYAINQKSLSEDIVYDLFAFYAIRAYENFNIFIEDKDRNNWTRFITFAKTMQKIEKSRKIPEKNEIINK